MKELILTLLLYAANASGLPMVDTPPKVIFRSECTIIRLAEQRPVSNAECQAMMQAGGYTYAVYDPARRAVVLPRGWSRHNPFDRSILVHELVHYLQDVHGVMTADSECHEIEPPAYAVQFKWLRSQGIKPASLGLTTKLVKEACDGR